MQKTKFLLGVIIALVVTFIGLRIFQQEMIADYIRPVILPLVAVYYCMTGNCKKSNLFYFLVFYAIAELLGIFYYYATISELVDNIMYFGCNSLYIIAYIFLMLEVMKSMNITEIINRFAVHIIILVALDIYCIILVSDVAIKSDNLVTIYDHALEFIYNAVIMFLLTVTLINYLARDSKKAMNLLLGALCIVFSEVIQVAYYYVSEINILSVIYSVLLVLAFLFFIIQTKMSYAESSLYEQQVKNVEV